MINLTAMDMGLSIGFFALFALFGSLDYSLVFNISPLMNETAITIIGILLLTGAMAKSAQIPLHSWLPGSMEGLKTLNIISLVIAAIAAINLINFLIFSYHLKDMTLYNASIGCHLFLILLLHLHYIPLLVIAAIR